MNQRAGRDGGLSARYRDPRPKHLIVSATRGGYEELQEQLRQNQDEARRNQEQAILAQDETREKILHIEKYSKNKRKKQL